MVTNSFEYISDKNRNNLNYFINLIKKQNKRKASKYDVALFGVMFPEEIIRALGLNPIWILGGDYELCKNADDVFPRDTDPVINASYSEYKELNIPSVIAFQNDSYRKLLSILVQEGYESIGFDFPASKNMETAVYIYIKNINSTVSWLERKYNSYLKPHMLYQWHKKIRFVRSKVHNLLLKYKRLGLNSYEMYIVLSAYYCCDDLRTYARNIDILLNQDEIEINDNYIKIKIVGSPIFFPNDKLFALANEFDVHLDFNGLESTNLMHHYELQGDTLSSFIEDIATEYYLRNNLPYNVCKNYLLKTDWELYNGVIYHVLKGQVTYDYDMLKLEKELERKNIPIIRIETDYNREDVEQIKIRFEAFIEMINMLKAC